MSENLVVASKIKAYVKKTTGMNTSAAVMDKLSEIVKRECDRAINNARAAKRKTIMDRDFD